MIIDISLHYILFHGHIVMPVWWTRHFLTIQADSVVVMLVLQTIFL